MAQFKSILLVDDDEATNFYHQIMLEEWKVTEHIYTCLNGRQALDFIRQHPSFGAEEPSLILLDINMPIMNGFEFLEEYEKLDDGFKATHVVVMLTTSLHDADLRRAASFSHLKAYFNKPLTLEQLEQL